MMNCERMEEMNDCVKIKKVNRKIELPLNKNKTSGYHFDQRSSPETDKQQKTDKPNKKTNCSGGQSEKE